MHSLTILFLSVATCVIWVLWRTGRREPGLPPGPPTVPILGNMLMFPKTERHLVFVFVLTNFWSLDKKTIDSQHGHGNTVLFSR
jgi:hypothetical protein